MTQISFWLAYWEYECCAPRRRVGDEVSVTVTASDGQLWERRHETKGDAGRVETISGRIDAIYWHPNELERAGQRQWRAVGHGAALSIDDTEKSPTRLEQARRAEENRARLQELERNRRTRPGRWRGVPGRWVGSSPDEAGLPGDGYDLEFVIGSPD